MINPHRIKFNNFYSTDFDLICCVTFESDNGETDTFLNREQIVSESYDGRYRRSHGFKYSDVFSPKFTFTKNNFGDFSLEEQRRVLSWLTSKSTASFLSVFYDDSEVIEFECLGGWSEISTHKLANNRTVAITATFESVSPFAFSPLQTITKDVSKPTDNKIIINLETDDIQNAVYPRITIKQNSTTNIISINHEMGDTDNWVDGSVFYNGVNYYWVDVNGTKHTSTTNTSNIQTTSVSIRNIYTDDYGNVSTFNTLVKKNVKGEIVTLDGANRVVSSSSTRIFGDDFDFNWIPLYEGKNELSFVGNCTVTIEYRTPIKCGEF